MFGPFILKLVSFALWKKERLLDDNKSNITLATSEQPYIVVVKGHRA